MARSKKGRLVSGWVIINKPAGIGSTTIVNKVKWAFQAQKAGHSGTLDPDATGVLAVALGDATKAVPYVAEALKCYRFRVALGATTTTDDASGEVILQSAKRPSDDEIVEALKSFEGDILQIPPKVSAVRVGGERAYNLAREGIEVDLAPRSLWVEELSFVARPDADHVDLLMVCGKGGYVRSIARDLGQKLGCLGHVLWLERTWSGPFDIEHAVALSKIEELARSEEIYQLLQPIELALESLPEITAAPEAVVRLRNGNPGIVLASGIEWGTLAWASHEGKAIAVGYYRGGELHPIRVFNS